MTAGEAESAPVWQPAMALLDDISRHTEAGAVLRASVRTGLLARLATAASVPALASAFAADEARVVAVLEVLRALGVAADHGESWTLTPPWAAAVAGDSPADLAASVEAPSVRMKQFERAFSGSTDYWNLPPDDRLVIARGSSFNPGSPVMAAMLRRDLDLLDGVVPALQAGGRVLELGCGVGSRLTALALAFPQAHCVGVELDADLAAYGSRRAAGLGVADRVTYIVGDTVAYEPDAGYDLVNWSQFFFPSATRAATLATAFRALQPGGWVSAPVIWTDDGTPEAGTDAQELALEALNLSMSGIPARTTGQVASELEAAGFTDVRIDPMPFISLVRGRR